MPTSCLALCIALTVHPQLHITQNKRLFSSSCTRNNSCGLVVPTDTPAIIPVIYCSCFFAESFKSRNADESYFSDVGLEITSHEETGSPRSVSRNKNQLALWIKDATLG